MSMGTPDWLNPPTPSNTPAWLEPSTEDTPLVQSGGPQSSEVKSLLHAQYEMVFPRVLEYISEGHTLQRALRMLPADLNIHKGAFTHWMHKRPALYALYKEAKEIRTEAWAGEIIKHATAEEGENGEVYSNDTARSRLIVDTYWKLMGADNRKTYGDTKTIELNTSISITAALEQAHGRVIEAQVINDDDELFESSYKQLSSAQSDDYEDDD